MQHARRFAALLTLALTAGLGCDASPRAEAQERAGSATREDRPAPSPALSPAPEGPVEVVEKEVPGDLPVFFLRGRKDADLTAVFMHGMCGHGMGYVQSFQWSAVARANVIGLQGDVPCDGGGTWRKWSRDVVTLDKRIDAALKAVGLENTREVVVIGYSQGGTRALDLAALKPQRYSRVVVIGAPVAASAAKLRGVKSVVVMAGEYDAPKWRRSQALALSRAGLRATYFELPGASHGAMGPEGERVMGEVLDWLAADTPTAQRP